MRSVAFLAAALVVLAAAALPGCVAMVNVADGGSTINATVEVAPGPLTFGVTNVPAPEPDEDAGPTTQPAGGGKDGGT